MSKDKSWWDEQEQRVNIFKAGVPNSELAHRERIFIFDKCKQQHFKKLAELKHKFLEMLEKDSWTYKDGSPCCLNTQHRTVCLTCFKEKFAQAGLKEVQK